MVTRQAWLEFMHWYYGTWRSGGWGRKLPTEGGTR